MLRGAGAEPLFFPLTLAEAKSLPQSSSSESGTHMESVEGEGEGEGEGDGALPNLSGLKGIVLCFIFFALRREAGVMFTDASEEESEEGLRRGVLRALAARRPFLALGAGVLRLSMVDMCLTGLSAPGFEALRLKLNVVWRIDLWFGMDARVCLRRTVERLERVTLFERASARFLRAANWAACSAASLSALSRAAADCTRAFLAFVVEALPMLRFFGELGALSEPLPEPKTSCSLRFVPARIIEAIDFSSWAGFFGLGPRTPRHDLVPQRHS